MADIRPFRGVHYSRSLIKDWSTVICPPYDIISPQQQQELYLRSEHNFVRLECGRELPQDTVTDNKYTRAAATLEQWLGQGILETDPLPAIYVHDHYFVHQGKQRKRRSLIARIRLEEWDKGIIRPHEGTLTEPRGDRLSLLWALQANTSPILTLFEDNRRRVSSLLSAHRLGRPLVASRMVVGEGHTLWALTDTGTVEQISASLAAQPLYIADGHHRYESALAYRQERVAYSPSGMGDEAFNFVMMALVDFADPGLLILAPHRLVRGISKTALDELMANLAVFFEIRELPLRTPGVWKQVDEMLAEAAQSTIVLFKTNMTCLYMLRLRELTPTLSGMMPYFHSDLYRKLDVSIIDHIILEKLLGLSAEKEKTSLAYSYDRQEAINRVLNQEYQLALLLRPVKPELVKAVADSGDKMPRKSTYFYPKAPAGLVCNRLV